MSVQHGHTICAVCDARVNPVKYQMRPNTDLWATITLHNMHRAPFQPYSPICRKCYRTHHDMIARPAIPEDEDEDNEQEGVQPQPLQVQPQENINEVPASEARCCICNENNRSRISPMVRSQAWSFRRIVIPPNNRICPNHLSETGLLTDESLFQLFYRVVNKNVSCQELSVYLGNCLHNSYQQFSIAMEPHNHYLNALNSNSDCICYTSLNLNDFGDFCGMIEIETMQQTTKQQAIALMLSKLRMGNSQDQLGHFFGLSQSQVSRHIDAASIAADEQFVPLYLGYAHITRDQIAPGAVGVLLDGTYFEMEKSTNFDFQKVSFSLQKHYNLVKFMFVTAPDGYILDIFGPTGSDGHHNDASLLEEMLADAEGFRSFFREDDILVVDRGFRDSIPACEALGLRIAMPPFLGGRKQLEREEADYGRFVTKVRWVIESVNGRVKNVFSFFRNQIPNTYMPKVGRFLRIASALLNAYFCPIYPDHPAQIAVAQFMVQKSLQADNFHQNVLAAGLDKFNNQYVLSDIQQIQDFPQMDEQDLRDITVGIYSIKNASSYTALHLRRTQNDPNDLTAYEIYKHVFFSGVVLVRMNSRYVANKKYHTIISYEPNVNGPNSLYGYMCSCQVGKRMVGMCCHVAAVLWLFSFARPNNVYRAPAENVADSVLNLRI